MKLSDTLVPRALLCIVLLLSSSMSIAKTLFQASFDGDVELVKKLLAAKADVNKARKDSTTPLWIASGKGHADVVQLLLEAKADVNKVRKDGTTPLWIASGSGYTDVVKLLLAAKADVNKAANNGMTPLYVASNYGHTKVVGLLLKYDADVNAMGSYRPLQVASYNGYKKIVNMLIDSGAEVNAPNGTGNTALDKARMNRHKDIERVLMDHGGEEGATPIHGWHDTGFDSWIVKTAIADGKGGFKEVKKIEVGYKQHLADRERNVEYEITVKSGKIPGAGDPLELIPVDNSVIEVKGKVTEKNTDGKKFVYVLSDILYDDKRNILSSWLVSNNTKGVGTNVKAILSKLKKPIRTGNPNKSVPLSNKLTLFYVNDYLLEKR